MSSLDGTLSASTVNKITQVLITKNPASTWLVSDGRSEKVIYFSTGGVRLYSSEGRRVANVEDYLVRRGLASREDIQRALEQSRMSRDEDLVEILERMECIPREKFQGTVVELIFLELCDLVTWENAIFEFYSGNPPPEIFDDDHPALFAGLDVKKIAETVQKWSKEWAQLKSKLYSERLCPKFTCSDIDLENVESKNQAVYRLINGQRTMRDIARSTGLSFRDVALIVRRGMEEGTIRGTLIPEKEPVTQVEVLDDIEQLEDALDKAINKILIHKRIANSYEKINDSDLASDHYHTMGNMHYQGGRVPEAFDNYRHAIDLSPQNIEAHESLIKGLQTEGEDTSALDEIFSLAKKLVSFGFLQRANDSLRGVVRKVPRRFDIRMLFADVLVKLGRASEAVTEYLGIAREKERMGAVEGIEELYAKILALDPVNREARRGMQEHARRKIGKRMVWINRLGMAAAILLVAAWGVGEYLAREAWAETQVAIEQVLEERDVEAGLETLRAFTARYPANRITPELPDYEKAFFDRSFYALEDDIREADRLRKQGHATKAKKLYRRVERGSLAESQVERARIGSSQSEAYRQRWLKVTRNAERLMEKSAYEKAFFVYRGIIENFPEGADGALIPFRIHSTPKNAEVRVNGVRRGYAPLWITVRYGRQQEVVLFKPGYPAKTVDDLEGRKTPVVRVRLEREYLDREPGK